MADITGDFSQAELNTANLERALVTLARGFQYIMGSADVPDGRSKADKAKGQALAGLANNYNIGCGMMAAMVTAQTNNIVNPADVAMHYANGSTITTWYDAETAQSGFGMVLATSGCKMSGGGKGKRRAYKQKGGAGPDRYDVFTIILIGAAGTSAVVAFGGQIITALTGAANFIVQHTVDYAVTLGLFKPQCDGPSGTAWNLFKQYTLGNLVPVESCIDKIRYNDQQVMAIKTSLGVLAGLLAPATAYFTKDFVTSGAKAVYNAIKVNISVPVVDAIVGLVNKGTGAVCSVASVASRMITRSRASQTPAPASKPASVPAPASASTESARQAGEAAQMAAEDERSAIETVTSQLQKEVAKAVAEGGSEEDVAAKIVATLKKYKPSAPAPASASEGEGKSDAGGARRRRKRATRKGKAKGKKAKKSKTAKRGRKGKSAKKGRKGKKGKKTRRGRK